LYGHLKILAEFLSVSHLWMYPEGMMFSSVCIYTVYKANVFWYKVCHQNSF